MSKVVKHKDINWDKVNERQAAARARQKAKMASPEYQAEQAQKQLERAERQRDKQNTPEYREKQRAKAKAAQERAYERARSKADDAKKIKTIISYPRQKTLQSKNKLKGNGLKGRTPTAIERRLMNKIGALPCVCCLAQGVESLGNVIHGPVALHHVEGRTKEWAHAKVLPLCQYHHDVPPPLTAPIWLFPLHGTGRKPWEALNGTQEALLIRVYELIDEERPWIKSALPYPIQTT